MSVITPGVNSGIPLGGLGTGSVELRGDGLLYEWQIFNNQPWGAGPATDIMDRDGLYFGLTVQVGKDTPRCLQLSLPGPYHPHLNDPYTMPWVEFPTAIKYEGAFPRITLTYELPAGLPLTIKLRAISPFIPLDYKNSGLPAAIFDFEITNTGHEPLEIALFSALKNGVLYDQAGDRPEVYFNGGGIVMSRESEAFGHGSFGSLALATAGERISYSFDWRKPRQIWEVLMAGEDLNPPKEGADASFPHGALANRLQVAGGARAEVPFILAWYFPNQYERPCAKAKNSANIGHKYSEWFQDAESVVAYMLENYVYLKTETAEFLETFYGSTEEPWLLDAVNAQLTTLPKSSWWDRQGRFGIWEGLGCCGLQTMDITHYGSFPLILFFPELQKSQMRLSTANVEEGGRIPHMMPGSFAASDEDAKGRIDLMPQFILLVWRDMLWTGDRSYIGDMFPFVKGALEFMRTCDTDGDGLPNNNGPDQTYDQFPMFGTSAFVGLLHAAAVMAAGDIAAFMNDDAFAQACREEYPGLLERFGRQLYNGEYFNLSFDQESGRLNKGCMLDQLNGEWFVRMTGRDGLLDPNQVKSALNSIYRLNRAPAGFWKNCAWEAGDPELEIPRDTTDQVATPWTGVEFMLASHFIIEDMTARGLEVSRDIWERYEKAGLRYNHIECGEHYYRAMSAWAVFLALQGFGFDRNADCIQFRTSDHKKTFLFNTPEAWGRVSLPAENGGRLVLEVLRGTLCLRDVHLKRMQLSAVETVLNGAEVPFEAAESGLGMRVIFPEAIMLRMGSELVIEYARRG